MESMDSFRSPMRSLLNGNVYKVSRIVKNMVVLDAIDGSESTVITELGNLKHFYKTVDYRDGS